jgi:hypothetical protein
MGASGQAGAGGGIPNPAVNAINAALRQPAPGTDPNSQGAQLAGGLAGVASTFKGPSIKVYKDQQKYQLWEFIFDLKSVLPGAQGVAPSSNPLGTPGQSTTNPLGPASPSGAGSQSTGTGTGTGTVTGATGTGNPQQQ